MIVLETLLSFFVLLVGSKSVSSSGALSELTVLCADSRVVSRKTRPLRDDAALPSDPSPYMVRQDSASRSDVILHGLREIRAGYSRFIEDGQVSFRTPS